MADQPQDHHRTTRAHVTRRAVVGAAAWSPPAIVLATAAPSHATSGVGNSVDVQVVPTTGNDYLVTLVNNTAAEIATSQLGWRFTRTGGTSTSGSVTHSGYTVSGFTGAFETVWTLMFDKLAPIPLGTSQHSFGWDLDDYTADVLVTVYPASGTGGSSATTYPGSGPRTRSTSPSTPSTTFGADGISASVD
ncbi:hypothetical protein [Nocardioides sp.]|uniref:hypothetical protein n=1 Tax=Nocardioides sp. TaxID=35761 RepID=UPI002B268FBD|nr:hypothetical protein [Nocardioides sp.]